MSSALQSAHGFAIEAARRDFIAFLGYAGVDDEGRSFESRELDRFVWAFAEECFEANIPACIMLPFGAGKTTLACWRAAWELGRNANLLISIVSYSSDRAQELVAQAREPFRLPRADLVVEVAEVETTAADALDQRVEVGASRAQVGHDIGERCTAADQRECAQCDGAEGDHVGWLEEIKRCQQEA